MGVERDLEEFVDRLYPRLVGSMVLYCGDRDAGEEVAQEALVRAIERWPRVRSMSAPEAWVFRVAVNLVRSRRRRLRRDERAVASLVASPVAVASIDTGDAFAVRAAVASLPRRQRAAVVARFYLGMNVAATATALRCAEGTVKALTHQGVARLQRELGVSADREDMVE